jgi:Na+/H+ antiporter NhaD/arsenite permease-like protein
MVRIPAPIVNCESICMRFRGRMLRLQWRLDYRTSPRIPMSPTPIVAVVLVPFVLWRVYQRVRRLMVRQRSQAWRHRVAVILFPLLIAVLGVVALAHPVALVGMAAGAACGAALGVMALRKTVYERIGGEFFYTPNARIGILVSMLFVGRLLYRGYEYYVLGAAQPQDFASSPITLMVFGVLAGYYTAYAAGLLRWRKAAAPESI